MSLVRYIRQTVLNLALVFSVIPTGWATTPQPITSTPEVPAAERARILNSFGNLPLSFIENLGQADTRVAYYTQAPNHSQLFTKDGHTLRMTEGKGEDAKAHTLKVELVGAAVQRIQSSERAHGVVSYFNGQKKDWKTGIPTHTKIHYVQPWPGIDLSYDGTNGRLESIYTVAAKADPSQIKLRYSGQNSLTLDTDGNLVYTTSLGEIKETAPIAWQDIDGQRLPVETRFILVDDTTVSFQVAAYNPEHALIIDPILIYAGYIGGNGRDRGLGIAVDSAGNAYVTGITASSEVTFPTSAGPDSTYNGGNLDAFVAKVNAAGTALMYTGYIGGSGDEYGYDIAVDNAGNAYITGQTDSSPATFPASTGPDLSFKSGYADAFVAKINSAGTALVYAGYIGGSGGDWGDGIAVDSDGNAYVTGTTNSSAATFPVTTGPASQLQGGSEAFVAKVNAAGTALVYAGYIGGNEHDHGFDIALDNVGNAYVTGVTYSSEATFPVSVGPDLTYGGYGDAFVVKVNAAGTALVYAGYIGGNGSEQAYGIAVDNAGNAYMTGFVGSNSKTTFPATVGPDVSYNGGGNDAFVAKVNDTGSALIYAGYIGGNGLDRGLGIAVDNAGNAYVTGETESSTPSFPATVGPDLTYNGAKDAFVAKVNTSGTALLYASYLGGSGIDEGGDIAVDSVGNAYVTGRTDSSEATFPAVAGPDLTYNGGIDDAFIAKIGEAIVDIDFDGVLDASDNCPNIDNPDQADNDNDGQGDTCDADDDNDTVQDATDNCPFSYNSDQADSDGDGSGNVCDGDLDGDSVLNAGDNCPLNPNLDQSDLDADGTGDACDLDDDNDGIADLVDNCPTTPNPNQADLDGDNIGDACDADYDGDGILNAADNCPLVSNLGQDDTDGDTTGDACDSDDDNDGSIDNGDNCPLVFNPNQADTDRDGQGDVCDGDLDGDGFANNGDNCPTLANSAQSNFDSDGTGDVCDADIDDDGAANASDLCAFTPVGETVDPSSGCSIAQLVPCAGPMGTTDAWKNHGQYVSRIAKTAESFVALGLITETQKEAIISAAAQSNCGK